MGRFGDPEPLAEHHILDGFASGVESLDRRLFEHARQAAAGRSARAQARRPVPAVLLARLAAVIE